MIPNQAMRMIGTVKYGNGPAAMMPIRYHIMGGSSGNSSWPSRFRSLLRAMVRVLIQITRKKLLMALVNQLPMDSAVMEASAPPMLDARVKAKSTKSIVDRSISPVQIAALV